MTTRLVIIQVLLLAGLSSIFLLPQTPPMKDAALIMKLPTVLTLSGWTGGAPESDGSREERAILARDTEFAKRKYRREVPISEQYPSNYYSGLVDQLDTGIVLSGKDLSGSIHALERCLTAQGFNIPEASTIKIKLRSGHVLPVRRLLCEKVFQDRKGATRTARSIAYYWFVGFNSVTSNHVKRGIKDFRDRIVGGYDQRWGYVTVTAQLDPERLMELDPRAPKPLVPKEGEAPPLVPILGAGGQELIRRPLTAPEADHLVDEFISDLGPDIILVDQIKDWPEE